MLLEQYYSSYNVADSKCSGLKIIESMLLYQRIAKATPFYWNVTEARLFCIMFPSDLSFYGVAESNSKIFMWMLFGIM